MIGYIVVGGGSGGASSRPYDAAKPEMLCMVGHATLINQKIILCGDGMDLVGA
jgi:hypothetical protein